MATFDLLVKQLCCPLCQELFTNPHSFPCGHTFCYECVIATIEGPGISTSFCPTCRQHFWKKDLTLNCQAVGIVEAVQGISATLKGTATGQCRQRQKGPSLNVYGAGAANKPTEAHVAAASPGSAAAAAGRGAGGAYPLSTTDGPLMPAPGQACTPAEQGQQGMSSGQGGTPLAAAAGPQGAGPSGAGPHAGMQCGPDAEIGPIIHSPGRLTAQGDQHHAAARPSSAFSFPLFRPPSLQQHLPSSQLAAATDSSGGQPPIPATGPHGLLHSLRGPTPGPGHPAAEPAIAPEPSLLPSPGKGTHTRDAAGATGAGGAPARAPQPDPHLHQQSGLGASESIALTPHGSLLQPPRSELAGWPTVSTGQRPLGGASTARTRPGSVVSIRHGTPSVNNAYLRFHGMLEHAVDAVGAALLNNSSGLEASADAVAALAVTAAAADGECGAGSGGEGLGAAGLGGFDVDSWLKQLLELPGPTSAEREALECELGIVDMFLGEVREQLEAAAAAAAGVGSAGAAAAGEGGPRRDAMVHGLGVAVGASGGEGAAFGHAGGGSCDAGPADLRSELLGRGLSAPGLCAISPAVAAAASNAHERGDQQGCCDGGGTAAGAPKRPRRELSSCAAPAASPFTGHRSSSGALLYELGQGCGNGVGLGLGSPRALGTRAASPLGVQAADARAADQGLPAVRGMVSGDGGPATDGHTKDVPPGQAEQQVGSDEDGDVGPPPCKRARGRLTAAEPGCARGLAESSKGPESLNGAAGCRRVDRQDACGQSGDSGREEQRKAARTAGAASPAEGGNDGSLDKGRSGADGRPKELATAAAPAPAADAAPAPPKEGQVPGGDADAVMAGSSDDWESDEGLGAREPPAGSKPVRRRTTAAPRNCRGEPGGGAQPTGRPARQARQATQPAATISAPAGSPPPHIVQTGLTEWEREQLTQLVRKVEGAKVLDTVGRTVTHLVVGVDGHMRVRVRTLKYLTAVMRGCWVVSGKWLQACLAAGRMVPEEPYEVKGDETGDGAPKAGRLRVQRGEPPLFLNKPFCLNYWASGKVNSKTVEQLLAAGGGKIVKRAVSTKQKQERLLVLLADKDAGRAATVLEECKQLPLTANWVFDSISHFRLLPEESYLVHPSSQPSGTA